MAALRNLSLGLGLGRRPVRSRVLVFHRLTERAARRLLPIGLEPRLIDGTAIATTSYARIGSLLPGRGSGTHHLAYRIAARSEDGPVTWVARRASSSRLGAGLSEKVLRRAHGRASFQIEKDAFELRLRARAGGREELFLHVEVGERAGSVFSSPEAVRLFLEDAGTVQPPDALAPETDRIDARGPFGPEPLAVHACRAAFLEEECGAEARLDGAWRLVPRRLQPVRRSEFARRGVPTGGFAAT